MTTRENILKHSLHDFAFEGYGGASMAKIAEKSGITKSTIYSHFSSKEDIYLAVLDQFIHYSAQLWKDEKKRLETLHTESALRETLFNVYKNAQQNRALTIFWHKSMISPPAKIQAEVMDKISLPVQNMKDFLTHVFTKGIKSGEIPSEHNVPYLVNIFFGLVQCITLGHIFDENTDPEKMIEDMFNYFWKGIGK
ncbi:TetR/AcrR family transcriptional regulator [Halobacillus yeomjeoni]|uniref:TetR/AcrR family transcriptional regulator n=1 Tax=Halobacillus yeomjeoni TaxID=311194 RepID=UPI001CD2360D|nr:TetR/AcrR family transcriptional regulator [Halobacillus yeomjeoni]MCA0983387.1 TetR/AcrR family transcriptional regulator [Halobacillus yeomjeoni]